MLAELADDVAFGEDADNVVFIRRDDDGANIVGVEYGNSLCKVAISGRV